VPPPGKRNFSPSFLSQFWLDFCLLIQSYGTFLKPGPQGKISETSIFNLAFQLIPDKHWILNLEFGLKKIL
jgi:hypothetical protein